MSLWLTCQILRVLVNTLAAVHKYPVLNTENFTIKNWDAIISEAENVFSIFFCLFEIVVKFWTFWKKLITVGDFVFRKLQTPKTWLDKCLKSPVLEDSPTSNIVHGPKRYWKVHHSTFIIFIDRCQEFWVRESLSYRHAKSWVCLLTHLLPMTSILFLIEKI